MKLKIEVPDERIHYLLYGHNLAFPWWVGLNGEYDDHGTRVEFYQESDEEEATGFAIIRRKDVKAGLQAMMEEAPHAWADFMSENDDMYTCDTAWQFIVFGKVVYS